MKRIPILLVAVLALILAACGDQAGASASATAVPTEEPTPEPSSAEPSPSEEPSPTDGADDGTALADLIPDEINGVQGESIPGMDQFMAGVLAQQGVEAEDIEFEFVTYGQDEDAIVLTAFRVPGLTDVLTQQLALAISGAGAGEGVETETVEIGGKSVLRMAAATGVGEEGVAYMYFADDAAFTIVSPSADTAAVEQLLSELP